MSFRLFILICVCGSVSTSFRVPIRHLYSFVDTDQNALMQHIVVHNSTREVYVSARNSLYRFDSNLGLKAKVSTGPELDNALCLHPSHNCTENLTQTDNDNKVLLIYYNVSQDMLLSCGTLYQGICQVRPLENIMSSSWVGPFDRSVGFVAGRESTIGFLAPGPSSPTSLYAASTYDDRTMEFSPVSVSSRVLSLRGNKYQFDYSHHSDTRFPGVDFDRHKYKKLYKVDYIAGFSHGGFSYFLTVQRAFPESVAIETRLARVCQGDQTFSSYTEVTLKCDNGQMDAYNMASAASMGPGIKVSGDVIGPVRLYVAFLKTVSEHGKLVDRAKGSVVCSYSMSQVVEYFTKATRDCFHAEPRTHLLKHVTGVDLKCSPYEDVQVDNGFCGSGFNNFIEGREAIPGQMRTHLDAYVTSLAVTVQRGTTVAAMGTDQGDVVKMVLERRGGEKLFTINIANETEDQSSSRAIQRQNAFDPSQDNIYFLTGHKVVKFPIGSCSVYRDCESCLRIDDPLKCGWCGSYCAYLEECETPDLFRNNSCRPVIYNVYPLSGPTAGKTQITILGDNFGSSQTGQLNSGIHVYAAGEKCEIVRWEKEKIECKTSAVSMPKSGPILINISGVSLLVGKYPINGAGSSSQNFSYAVPKMYGIVPSYGPVSGGTNITIYGEKLNIGAKRNITVNGVPCREFRVFDNISWCITGRHPGLNYVNRKRLSSLVEVEIDNEIIEYAILPKMMQHLPLEFQFRYRPDPQIESINPQVTSLSGIKNLTISGSHLDSVAHPKMVVIVDSSLTGQTLQFEQLCSKIFENGTRMMCPIPPLNIAGLDVPTARAPLVTHVSFIMDGVELLRDAPLHNRNLSQLLYYPDPEYFVFNEKDGVKLLSEEDSLLEIQGKNLGLSHSPSDIKVFIDGDKICNVTSVSEDKLYCVLPPLSTNSSDNLTQHTVDVISGPLTFHVGYVKLVDSQVDNLLLLISIAIGLLLVLICVGIYMLDKLCCRFKKRTIRPPGYNVATAEELAVLQASQPADFQASRPAVLQASRPAVLQASRPAVLQASRPEVLQASRSEVLQASRPAVLQASPSAVLQASQPAVLQASPTAVLQASQPAGPEATALTAAAEAARSAQRRVRLQEIINLLRSENIFIYKEYLTLGEVIGLGNFGCVYRGDLNTQEGKTVAVAVKTLHGTALLERDVEGFLQEAMIMKDFHHHNVLTLIGVCCETYDLPMVVIPFMEHGDLFSYIRSEDNSPTVKDLLLYGFQIAAGMEYLSGIKFVHRDLAARNCMLGDDGTVKVADFGLSRDIYERDYYSSDNKIKLPVKWMAPESLEKGTYNSKTDVWSYGVVLWELMTRGVTPYPEVDNWDILSYLKSGRRMLQPSHCPNLVYETMHRCWLDDSKDRPTFAELKDEVDGVIIELRRHKKQRNVGLNITYVNCPQPGTWNGTTVAQ